MDKNPRLELDFLRAQLARLEDGDHAVRLDRTQHLLKRQARLGQLTKDAASLRAGVARVQREIVRRKVHYAETVVQRSLKSFKKVEPLRIRKREAQADKSRAEGLAAEHAVVRALDAQEVSADIVVRSIAKRFDVQAVLGAPVAKRALTPAESNVYGRLCKTKAVRDALDQLARGVAEFYTPVEGAPPVPAAVGATQASAPRKKPAQELAPRKETRVEQGESASEGSDDESDDESDQASDQASIDTALDAGRREAPEVAAAGNVDPFFEQPVVISDDEDGPLGPLPLLNEGFVSGSDDESIEDADVRPARRNRRGQRARRKIWEQKYGRRANHVQKEQQEQQRLADEKRQRQAQKAAKQAEYFRKKQEFEARPLHPSWEAQLKRKREAAQFQGKKVKFS